MSPNVLALEAALRARIGNRVRRHEPMARHTPLGVGGPADLWMAAAALDELITAVQLARQHHCPVLLMGSGANLLVSDRGVRGLVIQNRCEGTTFFMHDEPSVLALSGTHLASLARMAARHGLSGLEWAVGVPGTLGGAVVNNAGAFGSCIADCLMRAELFTPDGERVWQPTTWFEYGYRSSRLKCIPAGSLDSFVVLRAELGLKRASQSEIEDRMARFNAQRQRTQPDGASLGSMFKNPPGDYAGRLIEAAGLKGRQIGGARISEHHANFFLNVGQACAADFAALIELARETVRAKFGVEMELEIQRVGEWE
ncbi:MAG: UDP-N-acetylmuramate dehydrogenase [Anaerolineae bacterium]|nr:UDP-N-acetylmuramate dehydrogenase [Anaerolineae bacterium]MDW8072589.1 UDP-N-acetylmuramate dehydrogenase [Anaerolineae bacterium]